MSEPALFFEGCSAVIVLTAVSTVLTVTVVVLFLVAAERALEPSRGTKESVVAALTRGWSSAIAASAAFLLRVEGGVVKRGRRRDAGAYCGCPIFSKESSLGSSSQLSWLGAVVGVLDGFLWR